MTRQLAAAQSEAAAIKAQVGCPGCGLGLVAAGLGGEPAGGTGSGGRVLRLGRAARVPPSAEPQQPRSRLPSSLRTTSKPWLPASPPACAPQVEGGMRGAVGEAAAPGAPPTPQQMEERTKDLEAEQSSQQAQLAKVLLCRGSEGRWLPRPWRPPASLPVRRRCAALRRAAAAALAPAACPLASKRCRHCHPSARGLWQDCRHVQGRGAAAQLLPDLPAPVCHGAGALRLHPSQGGLCSLVFPTAWGAGRWGFEVGKRPSSCASSGSRAVAALAPPPTRRCRVPLPACRDVAGRQRGVCAACCTAPAMARAVLSLPS